MASRNETRHSCISFYAIKSPLLTHFDERYHIEIMCWRQIDWGSWYVQISEKKGQQRGGGQGALEGTREKLDCLFGRVSLKWRGCSRVDCLPDAHIHTHTSNPTHNLSPLAPPMALSVCQGGWLPTLSPNYGLIIPPRSNWLGRYANGCHLGW